jgi:NAD(P)-dependent dehydrogenase (short-subunit alcohol dehydrogenase family)
MAEQDFVDASRLFDLRGKSAIVTGAARGIGRAIAEGLASVEVSVALADILEDQLEATCQAVVDCGYHVIARKTDICKAEDREALVRETIAAFGQVDILVNVAGITRATPSETYPDEDWDRTLAVNLSAMFRLCKLVAQDMIPRRAGAIINVSSIGGALGFPNNPAYQASKSGVLGLTRALATDWAKYNIRVNTICPGYTHTDMTEASFRNPHTNAARASRTIMNRWGEPAEMVGPVIFLASDAASYVTGAELFVDGGWNSAGLTEWQL